MNGKPTVIAFGADQAAARAAIGAGTSNLTLGTTGSTATAGNDSRLSDTRTPTDNTVSTAKLQDNSVTTNKIVDDSVTEAKLSSGVQTKLNQSAPTWTTIPGKPTVVAAGANAAAARDAIGAFSSPDVDATADYGAVADSLSDQSAALQAAINATPDGGRLRIRPGRYRIGTGLTCTGKSIYFDAPGVILVQDANVVVLTITGEFETIMNVSSLTPTNFDFQESDNIPGLEMVLSSSPSWQRGDVVKVVADDEIPGARPRPIGNPLKNRLGQFFIVHSVVGTTVTLSGSLRDNFTTNIRVARVVKKPIKIDGLRVESSDFENYTSTGVQLTGLFAPEVDLSFGTMPTAALKMTSCYRHSVKVVADGGNVAPSSGKFTYAVFDCGGESGQFNVNAGYVRHAYDDGATAVAADSSVIWEYGRPAGHAVTGIAHATLSACWSTHTQSKNVTFFNCKASDSPIAFGLRGRNNSILNGVAMGCNHGLTIFDEDRESQDASSFGHYIDGLILRGAHYVVQVKANADDATAPLYGQRETTPTIIRNLYADDVGVDVVGAITVTNQTVIFEDVRLVGASSVANSHAAFRITNSDVTLRDVEIDWLGNTSGSSLRCIYVISDSIVRGDDIRWLITSDVASRVTANVVSTAGTLWDVVDFLQSYDTTVLQSTIPLVATAGSKFDYRELNSGLSAAVRNITDANVADANYLATLALSQAPIITLRAVSLTANRTLAKLPDGAFRGQQLVIMNANTSIDYRLTIGHGTTSFTTSNIRGAPIQLWGKQSAVYTWNGSTWAQMAEPGLLSGTATLDFGSITAQAHADLTIAVTGAVTGDSIALGLPTAAVTAGIAYTAWVSAADTVTVRAHNYTGGTLDPASGAFKATVVR